MRFVRSIFVPEDETCFCVYQAASAQDVREAACRASLPFRRITPTIRQPTVAERSAGT